MGYRRSHAKSRDANEPEIVSGLEAIGAKVERNEPPLPDLTVGYRGRLYWMEVKIDLTNVPRGEWNDDQRRYGGLNKRQRKFHEKWGAYIDIVHTLDEAIEALNRRQDG